jgi:hypothetical protein
MDKCTIRVPEELENIIAARAAIANASWSTAAVFLLKLGLLSVSGPQATAPSATMSTNEDEDERAAPTTLYERIANHKQVMAALDSVTSATGRTVKQVVDMLIEWRDITASEYQRTHGSIKHELADLSHLELFEWFARRERPALFAT